MSDTIQANVYADNSFILYLNGELVAEDLIVFVPHKVISVYILAILDQIKSAQGLGGRVRQKFDAERSRKTVCKAISRSIEAIEKEYPELGLHLHKSINLGREVSYSPDVVVDWLF